VNDQSQYLYYTIGCAVFCIIANTMPYFFPFREHLANENDIIGSIIGTQKHGKSKIEPHHEPLVENEVSAKFHVEQAPLNLSGTRLPSEVHDINRSTMPQLVSSAGPGVETSRQ